MKNIINKIFLTGMIGAGSLGIFGNNGYGQGTIKKDEIPDSYVRAEYINHREFQIECWRELGDGEIVLNKYFDTNRDGKMDSSSLFVYSTEYNKLYELKAGKDLYFKNALYLNRIKKNFLLGKTYKNCKEGHFKEDIYNYIK